MTYHIIFPRGDRQKISVIELSDSMRYELSDYAVASRKEFYDIQECKDYAKELAKINNIQFIDDDEGYLD